MYHRSAAMTRVGLSVDGDPERELILSGPDEGPGVVVVTAERPLSVVRLRVLSGSVVLHGLEERPDAAGPLELDVFGFPGATVAGWRRAQLPYLASWFADRPYDIVMLMFGTNEANVPAFDPRAYRETLVQAVMNLRLVFPESGCVLIGPGDRGVLVSHRRRGHGRKSSPAKVLADALKFSRVHATISQIQSDVASEQGCGFFDAQAAMGGKGAAYRWVHSVPPLMARDLIHFTPNGYRELADRFAGTMRWNGSLLRAEP
jgi:lysophospholipase L1-like esterase